MDTHVERVARIICRHEAIASAIESAGSLESAYRTNNIELVLKDITDRAWDEHISAAKEIFYLFQNDQSAHAAQARRF